MSNSTAWFSSGKAWVGNSTSTTGPATATTRPCWRAPSGRASMESVNVLIGYVLLSSLHVDSTGVPAQRASGSTGDAGLTQRLGAADDLHDLGGDGVLAGPVHDPAQPGDQIVRVVGGRLHGPLTGGLLRRRRLEQGGQD